MWGRLFHLHYSQRIKFPEDKDRFQSRFMNDVSIDHEMPRSTQYVALLPAAGEGTRLPGRSTSKELVLYGRDSRARRPVIAHLLTSLRTAGILNAIVVVRTGKWDILDYLSSDEWSEIDFTYKVTRGTSGVPETVFLGLTDAGSRNVIFGFPDILFEPTDPVPSMIERLETGVADVVLGLYPTQTPQKMDMVQVGDDGVVNRIEIKPAETSLDLTWILAAWKPTFSSYLIDVMSNHRTRLDELASGSGGRHLGHAFQLAMSDGMAIESVSFAGGASLDVGTPDDLQRARDWG
jgi:glucose-1-phosphate thymidylyltransferase